MTNDYILTAQDLTNLFQIKGLFTNGSHSQGAFFNYFLKEHLKHKPEEKNFIESFLATVPPGWNGDAAMAKKFAQYFGDKLSLPQDYTVTYLFKLSYGSQATKAVTQYLDYLESKAGAKSLLKILEQSLFNAPDKDWSVARWAKLVEKFPSDIDIEKTNFIIDHYIGKRINQNSNSIDKTRALKVLCIVHGFQDNKEKITQYVNNFQQDALFIKKAKAVLQAHHINVSLEEEHVPIITDYKITGRLSLNSDYFVKKHGFSRKKAETYLYFFGSYMCRASPQIYGMPDSQTLSVRADNIEQYKELEEKAKEMISRFCNLVTHWKESSKEETHEFFKQYIDKIDLLEKLNENLASQEKKTPKRKI